MTHKKTHLIYVIYTYLITYKIFQNRLNVFLELLEKGELDKVSVDIDKSDKLIRLLDTVVIKLEGGTEEDLKELDEPPPPEIINSNDKAGNAKFP